MISANKKLSVLIACCLMQACNSVDNYILGQDNTPTPAVLAPLPLKKNLAEKWSLALGSSQPFAANLKPVIKGNIIYTANSTGVVQAVNVVQGKPLWTKKLTTGLVSGPSVAEGILAFGTETSTVVLLRQDDGKELWQEKVSGEVLAKPLIANHKIIAKTVDGNLYALDLRNGEKLWTSDHGAPNLILKASSSPVVVGDRIVLVGHADGKMDAVDLQTGQLLWQRSIAFANGASDVERLVDIDADPIVRGEVAYLGSYQGYVGALSLTDGQFLWRKPASVYKNMAIDENNLYLTDSDDIIWSLSRQNGQVNWKQLALKSRGLTEPVLMGNRLIVGDKTGLLHVIAKYNGELLSRTQLTGAITTTPAVAGQGVYVMTANGKLSRFSVS